MKEMMAAMEALSNIKGFAKKAMGGKRKPMNKALEEMDNIEGAVPGGSASKPEENPLIYGDSRMPENLDEIHEDDDDVTVVLMSGKKQVKSPKGRMGY